MPEGELEEVLLSLARILCPTKAMPGVDTELLDQVAHAFFAEVAHDKINASMRDCFQRVGKLLGGVPLSSEDQHKVLETCSASKGAKQNLLGSLVASRFGEQAIKGFK